MVNTEDIDHSKNTWHTSCSRQDLHAASRSACSPCKTKRRIPVGLAGSICEQVVIGFQVSSSHTHQFVFKAYPHIPHMINKKLRVDNHEKSTHLIKALHTQNCVIGCSSREYENFVNSHVFVLWTLLNKERIHKTVNTSWRGSWNHFSSVINHGRWFFTSSRCCYQTRLTEEQRLGRVTTRVLETWASYCVELEASLPASLKMVSKMNKE